MIKTKKLIFPTFAFITPILIFTLIYIINGLPKTNNIFFGDALHQYVPTFKYLYNVLHGNTTFPYTLSKGTGGTMYGAFFYGLSSPINLFVYFFKDVELFMILSTLLRIGLSGLTMYSFLRYKNNSKLESLIFSISYSLGGYTIVYFSNIMWMDAIWVAPLLLISINNAVKKKKYIMYVFLLLYSLISNYYTGYMLTFFSIIYYLYELYINNTEENFIKANIKNILYFFTITFFTGCLIAFILVPIAFESRNFSRDFPFKFFNPNFLDIFSGTYIGFGKLNNCVNYYGLLLYGGTLILPLILLYFTNKDIPKKEKKASLILLLIFILPVLIKPLSILWHLFTDPVGFNYRYSFLLEIFIIYLASKGIKNNNIKRKHLIYFFIFYIIISFSIGYSNNIEKEYYLNFLSTQKIIITLILLLLNIIFIIHKKRYILYSLLFLDLLLNIYLVFNNTDYLKNNVVNNLDNIINSHLKTIGKDNSYRYETIETLNSNPSLYYNYHGIDMFLSSNNINQIENYYSLNGIKRTTNIIKYNNTNMMIDNIFNIKYVSSITENKEYETLRKDSFENLTIYLQKNKYAFPLGYAADKKIKNQKYSNYQELSILEEIYNNISGKDDNYFINLKIDKINNEYIINNPNKYTTIFLISEEAPNNYEYEKFWPSDKYGICNSCNEEKIILKFDNNIENLSAKALDISKIEKTRKNLEELNINEISNNKIKGEISVKNDKVLIIGIPYEDGWTIYIDNKKVPYYKVLNGMIGLDIDKGNHKIEMEYNQPGLEIGISISCLSLCILIIIFTKKRTI